MDCSPPGTSVYGVLRERILEWVAIPFSKSCGDTDGNREKDNSWGLRDMREHWRAQRGRGPEGKGRPRREGRAIYRETELVIQRHFQRAQRKGLEVEGEQGNSFP